MKKNYIPLILMTILLIIGGIDAIFLKSKSDETATIKKSLESAEKLESTITNDKITISKMNTNLEDNSKVHLWIFSEPIDLGEFTLIKEDSTYYIENINDILKNKEIAAGQHKILIMQNDKALGYIPVELTKEKALKPTNENNKEEETEKTIQEEQPSQNEEPAKEENTPTINQTETPHQEQVQCTPKKFQNTYSYVFEDEDSCNKSGGQLEAFEYFRNNNIPASTYGCEAIVDDCGTTYYGVYYGNTSGEKFYY